MKLCFYKLIINNFLLKYKSIKIALFLNKNGDWGLGIGDWGVGGLGFGVLAPNPNPQSPIPNPQSPIILYILKNNNFILNNNIFFKNIYFKIYIH